MNEKADRHQIAPFPLRMPEDLRLAAQEAGRKEDRSMNWILNDRLRKAFGLKTEESA